MRRLVLLAPLVLLGCGSHKDFVSRGDSICRDVSKQVGALALAQQLADISGYVSKATKIEQDGLARLRALSPPAKLRTAALTYENLVAQGIQISQEVGDAAARNDATRQQQVNQQAATYRKQAAAAARKVGFKNCSK